MTAELLRKKAMNLVAKLQNDITVGKRQMIENYGQKEIRRFEEGKISNNDTLTYTEKCNIMNILYKVSEIC